MRDALLQHQAIGSAPWTAQTELALGLTLAEHGGPDHVRGVIEHVDEAATTAERLGMTMHLRRCAAVRQLVP